MRYGILSDIHSNIEALNAVLEILKKQDVESYLCLGDIVGYGPNPNECVEAVSALPNLQVVGGNHDFAVMGFKKSSRFAASASKVITWTKKQLTPGSKNFLFYLPRLIESEHYTLAHASARDPLDEYVTTSRQYAENLEYFRTPICFIGNTHIPNVFYTDEQGTIQHRPLVDQEVFKISKQDKTIVNVGSVGQARDGDLRAACAVFDSNTFEVTMLRCNYDTESVIQKMKAAKFPELVIERLVLAR